MSRLIRLFGFLVTWINPNGLSNDTLEWSCGLLTNLARPATRFQRAQNPELNMPVSTFNRREGSIDDVKYHKSTQHWS